jgi:hypothetical protein
VTEGLYSKQLEMSSSFSPGIVRVITSRGLIGLSM